MSRGSSAWRREAWGPPCKPDLVGMAIYSGGPRFQCDRRAREAFTLLGAVFLKHGYIVRRAGGYNCRNITGSTTSTSSHGWAISVDINDDTNPYRQDKCVTDMTSEMIADVYDIKTIDGVQVFRWGGDWDGDPTTENSNYDAMHFEIVATPGELSRGFWQASPDSTDALHHPVIRLGAKGPIVLKLQFLLGMTGTSGDGSFGPRTKEAVLAYQRSRGLEADGIVGHATWTSLLTSQPPLTVGDIGPHKTEVA